MIAEERRVRPVGLRDLVRVLATPRAVFDRIEDTPAYGPALVVMLALVTFLGYAEVQTGLIDRTVDQQTESALARLETEQGHLIDRVQLREQMEQIREGGEFNKLVARLMAIGLMPVNTLVSLLFIAAVLYAIVALTGRKPEWHTLMGVCVYAGAIQLVALTIRLAMVISYRTTSVDTSLAALGPPGKPTWLTAVDPFELWFWVLVAMGLIVTRQLGRKLAVAACVVMMLAAGGLRVAASYSMA